MHTIHKSRAGDSPFRRVAIWQKRPYNDSILNKKEILP